MSYIPTVRERAETAKPLIVSRNTAAVMLGVSVDKIDELIAWGALQTVKLGLRRVGIKVASIEHVAEYGVEAA